jgi:hypothetical protein
MDETDGSRPGDDAAATGTDDGREHAAERDPETVAATVDEVEGIEYEEGIEHEKGNVAGASPARDLGPVEPGAPTAEGALFVLLGVVLTLVVLAQLVGF